MDKVIIDGIDVSECEHYRAEIETKMPYGEYEIQKDKCHYLGIEIIQNCKGNKGCIYKQLQRAREEIEDIKTEYEVFKNIASAECERARAENERLKAENKHLTEKEEEAKHYLQEADKFQQCLQEIRELIKKLDLSLGCAYGDYDCDNCSDINEETVCKIKLQNIILAKINEVIGAEK